MQTKTDYIDGTTLQLDLWSDQFSNLEELLSRSAAPTRRDLRKELESLKKRRRTLKRRLREAAHGSTATDWEDVREPLEEAVQDFRELAIEVYDNVRAS